MANRYLFADILEQKFTKKKYFESTIYPKVKPNNNDIYIITEQSDRLDILANKYYGDTRLWWIIATANNLNDASLSIAPGTQLRIPANTTIIVNDLEKINK
jgi:hypothetical protein